MQLAQWLDYVEKLHPKKIDMGLERLRPLVSRMLCNMPLAGRTVTVAGTNGKGSTCATLEALALAHGLKVGCYTSPHIMKFNERIRINGRDVSDKMLEDSFTYIENLRGSTPLTYFEYTTLVAIHLFRKEKLDLAILEVGLGGRLDAVNCVDPDIAVITSIDIDHQQWLGNDRESIGREKAGILRQGIPLVIGETDPPDSVLAAAIQNQCAAYQFGKDFSAVTVTDLDDTWTWKGLNSGGSTESVSQLYLNRFPVQNQAAAIQAFQLCRFELNEANLRQGLASVILSGRFQQVRKLPAVFLDVGHNPHAAGYLKEVIERDKASRGRQWLAVFSALEDKDIAGIVSVLGNTFEQWHFWQMDHSRAAGAAQLQNAMADVPACRHDSFSDAYRSAVRIADRQHNEKDMAILVFGSFYVVEAALKMLQSDANDKQRKPHN